MKIPQLSSVGTNNWKIAWNFSASEYDFANSENWWQEQELPRTLSVTCMHQLFLNYTAHTEFLCLH